MSPENCGNLTSAKRTSAKRTSAKRTSAKFGTLPKLKVPNFAEVEEVKKVLNFAEVEEVKKVPTLQTLIILNFVTRELWKFNFGKENSGKENSGKENSGKENFGKVLNFAEVEEVKKAPNFAEVD